MTAPNRFDGDRCCEHRAADHDKFANGRDAGAGGRCTIPGCKCTGWKPHPTNMARGLKSARERARKRSR